MHPGEGEFIIIKLPCPKEIPRAVLIVKLDLQIIVIQLEDRAIGPHFD
jgi:hypothetical protein